MPCLMPDPEMTHEAYVEHMLCYTCTKLSLDDMKKYKAPTGYRGLFEWYASHLLSDICSLDRNDSQYDLHFIFYVAELTRIGYKFIAPNAIEPIEENEILG